MEEPIGECVFMISFEIEASVFDNGGENDLCFRSAVALDLTDEFIKTFCVFKDGLDEKGIFTRDVTTFDNVGASAEDRIKLILIFGGDLKVDKSAHGMTQHTIVDLCVIPKDDARFFHRLDARGNGGRGNKNTACNVFDGSSGVFFQDLQNFNIRFIKCCFHDCVNLRCICCIEKIVFHKRDLGKSFQIRYIYSFTLFFEKNQENLRFF